MRYYNENPQVTLFRVENEKLKKKLSEAEETIANLVEISVMKKLREREIQRHHMDVERKLKDDLIGFAEDKKYFNSLPWYKKMFYKFKL